MSEHEEQIFNLFILQFFGVEYLSVLSIKNAEMLYSKITNEEWFSVCLKCFPLNEKYNEIIGYNYIEYMGRLK